MGRLVGKKEKDSASPNGVVWVRKTLSGEKWNKRAKNRRGMSWKCKWVRNMGKNIIYLSKKLYKNR